MSFRLTNARVRLHDRAIGAVATTAQVQAGARKIADGIADDVRARTSSSSTIRPFGDRLSVDSTELGARVGTSWGPAVPVEFGTVNTPAHRILTGAAERAPGKVTLGGPA